MIHLSLGERKLYYKSVINFIRLETVKYHFAFVQNRKNTT